MHTNSKSDSRSSGGTPNERSSGTHATDPKKIVATLRRNYIRGQVLEGIVFASGIIITLIVPYLVFITYIESGVAKILFALSGIGGLLLGVAVSMTAKERQRKHRTEELRIAEAEFFERIRRGVHSRLA